MRNAIRYYYNMAVTQINSIEDYYLFDNYMLKELKDDINFDIYNILIYYRIKVHKIIFNIYNSYYTKIDNKIYVLYELCDYNEITMDEITDYNKKLDMIDISKWHSNKNNSVELWERKIDFYEKNYNINNNLLFSEVFPYYIGLSELAIRIYNEFRIRLNYKIVHRRIRSFYDFYCPDNFIIDSNVRDYSEFLKSQFFIYNKNVEYIIDYVSKLNLSVDEFIYFFTRICFPSYIYDYINNSKILNNFILKVNEYEYILNYINEKIHSITGIEIINWIKKYRF